MSVHKPLVSPARIVWGVVGVCVGVALVMAGRWCGPMVAAQRAFEEGRVQEALVGYRTAEQRLTGSLIKRAMPSLYDTAVSNELAIMYSLKQFDDVIAKAGTIGTPAARFWAGCALFAKADYDISDKNRLNWMAQAQQEFRTAIEGAPDDFDARFNFELTARLIAAMKQDPTVERPKDLQLLTPSSAQAPRKIS